LRGIDAGDAYRWGSVQALAGRPLPAIGNLLAASAQQHKLTMVTRNVKDFADMAVQLIHPGDVEASAH
jgi:predicted nucleic acid-binding protein